MRTLDKNPSMPAITEQNPATPKFPYMRDTLIIAGEENPCLLHPRYFSTSKRLKVCSVTTAKAFTNTEKVSRKSKGGVVIEVTEQRKGSKTVIE
jgi:hypothetical protein